MIMLIKNDESAMSTFGMFSAYAWGKQKIRETTTTVLHFEATSVYLSSHVWYEVEDENDYGWLCACYESGRLMI